MDPQISFTFDPEMPVPGQPFMATCTATIDAGVTGLILLQWRNESGDVISTGSGRDNAEAVLVIDNFSFDDANTIGGYQCSAAITAQDDTFSYNIMLSRNIQFTCEIH